MTAPASTSQNAKPADERIATTSFFGRLFTKPEAGAIAAALVIAVLFSIVAPQFTQPESIATTLYGASTVGIMAVGVSLLMIGGEVDLSAGVAVTTAGLTGALTIYWFGSNVWVGVIASLIVSLALGLLNGWLLTKTKLTSFIVTLATFFMLTGINLGVTRLITGGVATPSIAPGTGFASAAAVFASEIPIFGVNVKITVFYWILLVLIATWILNRTRAGNWIFASGGAPDAARAVGVPVVRTKIGLYMGVSFCAWLLGMHQLFAFRTVQSGEGVGNEFLYIIAAVVGGCLMSGGRGSAIGAAIGALIYGMALKGVVYAQWNPDWLKFFLGAMLLGATVLNFWLQRRAGRGDKV
ncbi:ABC transporter permease [Gulosibacter molinativorax]|uniref:Xylose transport system permease protein XylH n=1 Tax=Gulosibacter molinativorax TaxID=256821 RepID=A0ABT7C7Q6_9MICO|nr:ABC transporter permease [Gulosibacter molinativorax]MDJ1371238.1 ABC transporter permease [Gulosibacter molinativorax]QUY63054.1 Putative ABC transporter permease protein YphD [Gulosibacter molinativorax]